MFLLLATAVFFTVVGIILTLAIQCYFLNSWLDKQPVADATVPKETGTPKYQLPKELKDFVDKEDNTVSKETCLALNLFFQFLYKELKDTKRVRSWFMKKLSVEFEELLHKTTTGRLIAKLTLRDLVLGTQFPLIKECYVTNVQLHEAQEYLQELDITMDLDYSGGFQLSVDADLVLGRTAFLAVQITRLSGKVRLQLTRSPFTHWSIVFCQEPTMQFKVESHFQGRPIPQVTSLIISQIRRAIKKKHTLPNYKVRFKPFFDYKLGLEMHKIGDNSRLLEGQFQVTIIECSRLSKVPPDSKVYCTLGVDSLAWVELFLHQSASWMTYDVEINKLATQPVGIVFKQEFLSDKVKQCVVVENTTPESPASNVDLRKGDILVSINNVKINTFNQTAKLLRQASTKFLVRVERRIHLKSALSHGALSKMDEQILSLKDVDANLVGDEEDDIINFRIKSEDSDGSPSNSRTPTLGSPVKKILLSAQSGLFNKHRATETARAALEVTLDRRRKSEGYCDIAQKASQLLEKPPVVAQNESSSEDQFSKNVDLKKTSVVNGCQDPVWEEKFLFDLDEHHRYLNLAVLCKKTDKLDKSVKGEKDKNPKIEKDVLLGQVSISLLDVTLECATNSQGFHQQTFQLKPSTLRPSVSRSQKLSSHPGFDETLCHGDITLAFTHKPASSPKPQKKNTPFPKPTPAMSIATTNVDSDDDTDSAAGDSLKEIECLQIQAHDFIGTQFRTATLCHFCGKKIWLKVAYQCRNCNMISHKKCVTKCQSLTTCALDGAKLIPEAVPPSSPRFSVRRPEIVTTDLGEDQPLEVAEMALGSSENTIPASEGLSPSPPGSPKTQRRRLTSLLANIANTAAQAKSGLTQAKSGLTRVGSAHNLAPPLQHCPSQSKSLPPSPQYSPMSSRKASLQGNPFHTTEDSEPEEDMELTVQRLLLHPNDEVLVSAAKEMGKELYTGLPLDERKGKLNAMIKKVQVEIEAEADNRVDLSKEDKETSDVTKKTRLAFQIAKSDERSRALAVLLLHYYAGIQHCNEVEDANTEVDACTPNRNTQSTLQQSSGKCVSSPYLGAPLDISESVSVVTSTNMGGSAPVNSEDKSD